MFRRILSVFCAACLLLCTACAAGTQNATDTAGGYDLTAAAQMREDRYVYLTIWSWQIPDADHAEIMAREAKESGFTAIDLAVLWAAFEPIRNHFDFSWLDAVMDVFRRAELPVSLSPLLWTKDLRWADAMILQTSESGEVFDYDGRGGLPCLCDAETRAILTNTLQAFFLHASRTYGANLTRWGVRLSAYGEFDFSVNAALDFSAPMAESFTDALIERFGDAAAAAQIGGLLASDRETLLSLGLPALAKAFPDLWRVFRQNVLLSFADLCSGVMRSADHSVPILLHVGTFGNGMNGLYSAWIDLRAAARTIDCDILGVSLTDGVDDGLLLSLVSDTGRDLSVELDGAWALDEGRDVAAQAELCGTWGVFALSSANFTAEELAAHRATLQTYREQFFSDRTLDDAADDTAILILPGALIAERKTYAEAYGEIYRTLSQNGARRVRFLGEEELISLGADGLRGVKTLETGAVETLAVTEAFLAVLAASDAVLSVSEPVFVPRDGVPFSAE